VFWPLSAADSGGFSRIGEAEARAEILLTGGLLRVSEAEARAEIFRFVNLAHVVKLTDEEVRSSTAAAKLKKYYCSTPSTSPCAAVPHFLFTDKCFF
jgi:hypothetical protein